MSYQRVRITAGAVTLEAELYDTDTARKIYAALPLRSRANTWGDEIYFSVPLKLKIESGREVVGVGDVAYWPDGPALCLFFGPTPISSRGEIRAASAVAVVGRISGDATVLKNVRTGTEIVIEGFV